MIYFIISIAAVVAGWAVWAVWGIVTSEPLDLLPDDVEPIDSSWFNL